ncbi:mannitol-1-phosphate 5-dehydrogenase [Desertibacillus haloalkaliphilus]|uniref:mannitol-1-phosphate 5-dehydrogenase n=1 Tax=Desertibacillus haloalkaliphilus TaxID=1328930 RepID=UPI001C26EF75|nr:mannitol-1-phosphate 5-dehydrogenase [Desertibacillus haloalkaliphilus]MBU8908579.1 mannitol-1-phosphate 5-dehydrogenase [Desertibacillus haloalkaliphilus]
MKQTVHFGAGNIGRGFIGALFSQSNYHVTFIDIAEQIINKLNEENSYQVKLATEQEEVMQVDHVSGLNNMTQENEVVKTIQDATYVTTAIGPDILPRIAPLIARGIAERVVKTEEKLYVIACENQIGATDILKKHILDHLNEEIKGLLEGRVYFFNSAVDRIVPIQNQDSLDVLVEPYYEWVVETKESIPPVKGMKIVEDLAPFIERKLFTVNTGHAVIAYLGYIEGKETIDKTLADPEIANQVEETLKETGAYLIKRYAMDEVEHLSYINKNIDRFKNPYLNDSVTRVGRAPIRKLGPEDRLVRPITEAYKEGLSYSNLAKAIAAALMFDDPEDKQAVELQGMIEENGVAAVLKSVSNLNEDSEITKEVIRQYEILKG